jgi:hypothetical protein
MPREQFSRKMGGRFSGSDAALEAIQKDGFDWRLVREYFRFTDDWMTEGEYDELLAAALSSIADAAGKDVLLDMLDLQYAIFLEQVALQKRMIGKVACEEKSVAFGERVMAYLELNSQYRPSSTEFRKSARTALLEIRPGQMIHRLLGGTEAAEPRHPIAPAEDNT